MHLLLFFKSCANKYQMQTLFQDIEDDDSENSDPGALKSVLVPYPVDKAYSYAVPDELDLKPGDYVTVPLGNREVPGVVWDDVPDNVPAGKVKEVVSLSDLPPMPEVHRQFIDWSAQYNMAPRGAVLKMTLSAPAALDPPKPVTGYRLSDWVKEIMEEGGEEDKARPSKKQKFLQQLSPQRRKILDVLADNIPRRAAEIADMAECTPAVVRGMLDKGILEIVELYSSAPCRKPRLNDTTVTLSEDQEAAAAELRGYIKKGGFHAALLDGVTGAGKTEVYFEAVTEALKQGRQALILLPEIALSNAFLDRFKQRFGCRPALWHSALTPAQRRNTWRGVALGETKVVIGARSALYLPYQDLGQIVVDEEHDPAYKQEDGVIYNARDMAVVRAHLGGFPIVLVSATPSLETMMNCWNGRYEQLHLPDRHGGASLPDIHMVDLREDRPERQHFIAPTLKQALADNLEKSEQSLLFLNRRGYAPLTLCRSCGHRMECPRCTAWLIEHKHNKRMLCHHCGFTMHTPETCPACEDKDSLAACGPGVERVHEEISEYFPEARTLILASDTAQSAEELRELLRKIRDHEYDIIIGTQIIAKGHHFPRLTCVGIVDADLGLRGGDLRAAERTYQLLHQVAGRAGREELPGHVYLQTWFPDNKVMQALVNNNRDAFLQVEAAEREAAFMPPYSRLAALIISGKDEQLVMETARAIGRVAPRGESLQIYGPAEAPFYRLRGNYRRRLLVQADKKINLQKFIDGWLQQVKIPSAVRVHIDIDPQSFL